jgi:hypothetical protein
LFIVESVSGCSGPSVLRRVRRGERLRVIGAEHAAGDLDGLQVQLLRLVVPAETPVHDGERVHRLERRRILVARDATPALEVAGEHLRRRLVPPLLPVQDAEPLQCRLRQRIVAAEIALANLQRREQVRLRLVEHAERRVRVADRDAEPGLHERLPLEAGVDATRCLVHHLAHGRVPPLFVRGGRRQQLGEKGRHRLRLVAGALCRQLLVERVVALDARLDEAHRRQPHADDERRDDERRRRHTGAVTGEELAHLVRHARRSRDHGLVGEVP